MANRKRLIQIDNEKCLLAMFVNEEFKVYTGFTNWLLDKDENNLCNIIEEETIVSISWPNIETAEANTLGPKLATCDFAKYPARILCSGKMRDEQKYYERYGKLSSRNKGERKTHCNKISDEYEYNNKEKDAPAKKKMTRGFNKDMALAKKINDLPKSYVKINYDSCLKEMNSLEVNNLQASDNNDLDNLRIKNASLVKENQELRALIEAKNDKIRNLVEENQQMQEEIILLKNHSSESPDITEDGMCEISNTKTSLDEKCEIEVHENTSGNMQKKDDEKKLPFHIKKEYINQCNKEGVQVFTKALMQKVFTLKELGSCSSKGFQCKINIQRGIDKAKPPLNPRRKAAVEACVLKVFSKEGSLSENKKNFNSAVRSLLAQMKANAAARSINLDEEE